MDTSARDRAVERVGSTLTSAGFPRLPSRVFAALLIDADGRRTSAELARGLGVSAAGVSGAVRFLEQLGWVTRERERGSRRDVYVVEEDAWHHALLRADQTYAPIRSALTAAEEAAEPAARARLALSREFLTFVQEEMAAMAARWQERRRQIEGRVEG
jgi:DNA-binding transcriptional regulator GbsR (MarR family)